MGKSDVRKLLETDVIQRQLWSIAIANSQRLAPWTLPGGLSKDAVISAIRLMVFLYEGLDSGQKPAIDRFRKGAQGPIDMLYDLAHDSQGVALECQELTRADETLLPFGQWNGTSPP